MTLEEQLLFQREHTKKLFDMIIKLKLKIIELQQKLLSKNESLVKLISN